MNSIHSSPDIYGIPTIWLLSPFNNGILATRFKETLQSTDVIKPKTEVTGKQLTQTEVT
jgi:hypothetical protein